MLVRGLKRLEEKVLHFRLQSVQASTRRARKCQWKCYVKFCSKYSLNVFPCTSHKLSLYVSELSRYMKPSSIASYLQGVVFVHNVLGMTPPKVSHPHLKATLGGINNDYPGLPDQKAPIFMHHIRRMRNFVVTTNHYSVQTWIGCLLMFRCLLRVGQVVDSPHTLTRDCVTFMDYGCAIEVRSSKSTSRYSPPILIPISRVPEEKDCVVYWLKKMYKMYLVVSSAPLFSSLRVPVLSYSMFTLKFKELLDVSGIRGNYSSHSLRRGGATSMSQSGVSVTDIKLRGRWKSACVNKYI